MVSTPTYSRPVTSAKGIVGRDTELAQLSAVLSQFPAVAVVEGDAGVGKTRLVSELVTATALADGRFVFGSCHRIREPFPLGPVIEAVRSVRHDIDSRKLSPVTGALRRLLPELGPLLPPEPGLIGDRAAERHRVFRSLVEVLSSLGNVILVLEDLHCAGGSRGPSSAAYAYSPADDEWSPIASLPVAMWGGAYAVVCGELVISGGVVDSQVTNEGYAYSPAGDQWRAIAPAIYPTFRAGSACGFYRIGGSAGSFRSVLDAERLPGAGECRGDIAPSWLAAGPLEATIAPGESLAVPVELTADVDQPGDYHGRITVEDTTPYPTAPLNVTMAAITPNNWGQIIGTVAGDTCHGEGGPLSDVAVQITGKRHEVELRTDAEGGYSYWFAANNNPLTVTVAREGHHPQTRRAPVKPQQSVEEDFRLRAICPSGG